MDAARGRVVAAFAAHWSRIARSRKDIAKERAGYFFAGSRSARERLARDFYGREHARQMARLNDTEIRKLLSPWLEHALRYWLEEYDQIDDPSGDDFLAELPTAEYVSIVTLHHSGAVLMDRYPGERVLYDDLYERTLSGCSRGGVLRIYKSTGERFTPSESRSARAGIVRDLRAGIASAGDEDDWVFDTQSQGCWESANFKGEDRDRVVIVEASDFPNRSLGEEGVPWQTTPPKRQPAVVQRIDSFNSRGMRLVYGRGDCWPHRSFQMDVWADRESRLFYRFWSRSKGVKPESYKVEGLKPIPADPTKTDRFSELNVPETLRHAYDWWIASNV
jgi:hypothetical protein